MSRFLITKETLAVLLSNLIIIPLAFLFIDSFNMVTILAMAELIICATSIICSRKNILSVGLIFLFLTFLFNFGQSLIISFFDIDKYSYKNVISQVGYENYIQAEIFAILCIAALTFGYLGNVTRSENYNNTMIIGEKGEFYFNEKQRVNKLMLVLVAVTIVPMLYIDISKIFAYLVSGYDSTYSVYMQGIGKYINLISQFCKPAVCVLIYTNSENKRAAKNITIAFLIYCGLMMVSGDRGSNIIYMLAVLFVYYRFVAKIKIKTIIIGIVGGYLLLMLITMIGLTRSGSFSIDTIISAYQWRKGDGVIYSTLREFGGSIISLCHSMNYFPTVHPFNCGLTYVVSWVAVLPKYPEFFNVFFGSSFGFTQAFPENASSMSILGGNYLGELYFNFGWFGFIGAFYIGKFISKMDTSLFQDKSVIKTAILIVLFPSLLLWVRDFYMTLLFKTVWIALYVKYFSVQKKER